MFKKLKLFFTIFIGIFLILFFILNGLAFISLAQYKTKQFFSYLENEIKRPPSFLVLKTTTTLGQKSMPFLNNIETSTNFILKKPISSYTNNTLILPKFEIEAPIIKVSKPNLNLIYQELKKGVVLYPGSSNPGEGYSIIIGHSSQYPWEPGRYKSVFSLLNQLQKEDLIYLIWENKFLVFKVEDKKIFLPWPKGNETTETVFPPSSQKVLILQSCWPVGVASKRVAVKAVLVENF
ncbi:MAG TPA: sortase [Candidatus Paceibacterota bacterium]|nr:sortase [Candidatus Paceibacterota bacterium]